MSDTPETLDDVLAMMRRWAEQGLAANPGFFADRIEAAVARERNAHTNDIHDALYMATGIPGNVASLRAALERIVGCCEGCHADACEKVCRPELTSESIHAALAALAAPARNCDRFQNWEDAASAWDEYSDAQYAARRKPIPVIPWLFAPVEGGRE